MNITRLPRSRINRAQSVTGHDMQDGNLERVYAISFDLNLASLARCYSGTYQNAYDIICRVLAGHGFQRQQQSLYFGKRGSTAITCVLAVQDLQKRHPWFRDAVADIRMMRIEELNDLYPALGEPELPLEKPGAA